MNCLPFLQRFSYSKTRSLHEGGQLPACAVQSKKKNPPKSIQGGRFAGWIQGQLVQHPLVSCVVKVTQEVKQSSSWVRLVRQNGSASGGDDLTKDATSVGSNSPTLFESGFHDALSFSAAGSGVANLDDVRGADTIERAESSVNAQKTKEDYLKDSVKHLKNLDKALELFIPLIDKYVRTNGFASKMSDGWSDWRNCGIELNITKDLSISDMLSLFQSTIKNIQSEEFFQKIIPDHMKNHSFSEVALHFINLVKNLNMIYRQVAGLPKRIGSSHMKTEFKALEKKNYEDLKKLFDENKIGFPFDIAVTKNDNLGEKLKEFADNRTLLIHERMVTEENNTPKISLTQEDVQAITQGTLAFLKAFPAYILPQIAEMKNKTTNQNYKEMLSEFETFFDSHNQGTGFEINGVAVPSFANLTNSLEASLVAYGQA